MMNLESPPRPYIDMLRDELAERLAKRQAAIDKLAVDQPEYLEQVLKMWEHAIGVTLAKIAREESAHASPVQF